MFEAGICVRNLPVADKNELDRAVSWGGSFQTASLGSGTMEFNLLQELCKGAKHKNNVLPR